jgi:hypothetical protein
MPFAVAHDVAGKDHYKLWLGGSSEGRRAYEHDLVRLVLDESVARYGDYSLETNLDFFTTSRSFAALDQAKKIQISVSSNFPEHPERFDITRFTQPVYEGLLGYRKCIIRRQDLTKFLKIDSEAQLQTMSAGQGRLWPDTKIYRDNHFGVVSSESYDGLFLMLKAGRFDYIPLGSLEVEESLEQKSDLYPDLVIAPNLVLYYPLPMYILASNAPPRLLERLKYGISRAYTDGTARALFGRRFSKVLDDIASEHMRFFILKNYDLPLPIQNAQPKLFHQPSKGLSE